MKCTVVVGHKKRLVVDRVLPAGLEFDTWFKAFKEDGTTELHGVTVGHRLCQPSHFVLLVCTVWKHQRMEQTWPACAVRFPGAKWCRKEIRVDLPQVDKGKKKWKVNSSFHWDFTQNTLKSIQQNIWCVLYFFNNFGKVCPPCCAARLCPPVCLSVCLSLHVKLPLLSERMKQTVEKFTAVVSLFLSETNPQSPHRQRRRRRSKPLPWLVK